MIVETIVTTVAPDGTVNVAPMGVEWGAEALVLKPFLDTVTYRNVAAAGVAVVNTTDDVLLFAQAALSNPSPPVVPARVVSGVALADACAWREVRVRAVDSTPPRSRIDAEVVHVEHRREFLGFNRARAAVLEATIYATRLHMLDRAFIDGELARLQVIVDKTAGEREHEAMRYVAEHVRAAPPAPRAG